jgi:hypothetical protein
MFLRFSLFLALLASLVCPPDAFAGMPAPLPSESEKIYRLGDSPLLRLQTISFFAAGLLFCAAAVQAIWNFIGRDLPTLPRLTFLRALGAVVLWGLLFVIVLTMISGARELMTPGAWKKQGFVYKLADDQSTTVESDSSGQRRQALEKLRRVLWQFAATHNGHFPGRTELSPNILDIPDTYGMQFFYVSGLSADQPTALLAYEPELQAGQQLVLYTDGTISTADAALIKKEITKGQRP